MNENIGIAWRRPVGWLLSRWVNAGMALLALAVAALIAGLASLLLTRAAQRLEESALARDVARLRGALRQELAVLDATCRDWAYWKAMHLYAITRDPDFEKENLSAAALRDTLNLQAAGVYDPEGTPVWGRLWTDDAGETNAADVLDSLMTGARAKALMAQEPGGGGEMGFVWTRYGLMLVAARPILPGPEGGESAGVLVFGRLMDNRRVLRMGARLGLRIRILDPRQDPSWSWRGGSGWERRRAEDYWLVARGTEYAVALPVPGVLRAAALVELTWPRDLMRHGRLSATGVAVTLFLTVLVLFSAATWLLRLQVREVERRRGELERALGERVADVEELRQQALALLTDAEQQRQRMERSTAEQRRLTALLQESEARHQALFESSRFAMLLYCPGAGVIAQSNRAAATLFGAAQAEDMLAHSPVSLSPARQSDGRSSAEAWLAREAGAAEAQGALFRWRFRRLDGTEFDAAAQIAAYQGLERRMLAITIAPSGV